MRKEELNSGSGNMFLHQLKQIGVRAGTMECNGTSHRVNFVDKYPIALNMTFKRVFPFAMKRMVTTFRRQWLFVDEQTHYFGKFMNILAAFLHKFAFFFERSGKPRFQHGLIVRVQIHQHFFKRIVQFGGDFPPHHGSTFLNGGDSFSIGHIIVRGADRTFTFKVKTIVFVVGCRGISKNNPTRRNFGGYVNSQPVAGGHFNSLFYSHKENIA